MSHRTTAELAAAIGYAGTLLFFSTSIAIGLSIAATALTARALGRGNRSEAREIAEKLAYKNAERAFGRKISMEQIGVR